MSWPAWAVVWYTAMLIVGTANVCAAALVVWRLAGVLLKDPSTRLYQTRMVALCVPFVLVCAFRGFFPNVYLYRYVFVDTALSSILLHRTLASIAEVCWMGQVALALSRVIVELKLSRAVKLMPRIMVVFICIAEVCSFTGTITKNSFFFMCEEGLWVVSGWMIAPLTFSLLYTVCKAKPQSPKGVSSGEWFIRILSVCYIVYCPWGVIADVPANYHRWRQEVGQSPSPWFTVGNGIADALNTRNVTHSIDDWGPYLLWMTSYFTLGVWSSLALSMAPRLQDLDPHTCNEEPQLVCTEESGHSPLMYTAAGHDGIRV